LCCAALPRVIDQLVCQSNVDDDGVAPYVTSFHSSSLSLFHSHPLTFPISTVSYILTCATGATSGNTHLGGEDFDHRLMEYCIKQFKRQTDLDISKDKRAVQRLRKQCELAKRTLSTQTSATIDCEALYNGIDFTTTISRAKFEELNQDLFKKTLTPVTQVLKDAGMSKNDIDEIILVGGSTRIPKIQQMLTEYFNGKTLNKSINPDEAVVS
jgi:molecular chaperone DnaK (HSP70)